MFETFLALSHLVKHSTNLLT